MKCEFQSIDDVFLGERIGENYDFKLKRLVQNFRSREKFKSQYLI